MDRTFARCVDHIALHSAPPDGAVSLLSAACAAQETPPRAAQLRWLANAFRSRRTLFSSPDWTATPDELRILAIPALTRRALGHARHEHPTLPPHAWRLLCLIARAGPAGVLQSDLASRVSLSPAMVSHYLGALATRCLVAKKHVVLTTRRSGAHPNSPGPLTLARSTSTTYTSVIVLARYAPALADADAHHPATVSGGTGQGTPGKSIADVTVEVGMARVVAALREPPYVRPQTDLKAICMPASERPDDMQTDVFRRKRHRAFRVARDRLIKQGVIRQVERRCIDAKGCYRGVLKCFQLCDTSGLHLAHHHDATAPVVLKTEEDGDFGENDHQMDVSDCEGTGQARPNCSSVHPLPVSSPSLATAPDSPFAPIPAPVSSARYDNGATQVLDSANQAAAAAAATAFNSTNAATIPCSAVATTPSTHPPPQLNELPSVDEKSPLAADKVPDLPMDNASSLLDPWETDGQPHLLAEVDLIEQVYHLLRRSGSRGMSVPQLVAYLDGGSGVTAVSVKRIRNILNKIKSIVPVVETQTFAGSAMHVTACLAEYSDLNGILPTPRKTAVAKMSTAGVRERRDAKSELARRKDGLTSLGLQRKELVASLLAERKAIVIESLGREIAQLENSGLHRVDQKVMRRIINELVADKRANMITTMKPSIKESNRWQTIKLVVLPELDERSSEVCQAITAVVDRALYGGPGGTTTPHKRKAVNQGSVAITDRAQTESFTTNEARAPRRKRAKKNSLTSSKRHSTPKPRSIPNFGDNEKKPDPDKDDASTIPQENSHISRGGGPVAEVMLKCDIRDRGRMPISRLIAIDYGLLKGRMARLRVFHTRIVEISKDSLDDRDDGPAPPVQHSTVEAAQGVDPFGSFTIFSLIRSFTVAEYAATVGVHTDHGDIIASIRDEKIADVIDVLQPELQTDGAARQLRGLVQGLVRLGLLQSAAEARWTVLGAGIIRDFGKGLPVGVAPHGIIFSSSTAVSEYWRELQQFSHFRCVKWSQGGSGTDKQCSKDEVPSRFFNDVYNRNKWSEGLEYTFHRMEQLHFETVLQELCGVEIDKTGGEGVATSNFRVMPLRRFSVEELFDCLRSVDESETRKEAKSKIAARNRKTERLLLYSRFRSENFVPSGLCGNKSSVEAAPGDAEITPTSAGPTAPTLRLVRGRSSLQVEVVKKMGRSFRPSPRKSLTGFNRDLRRMAAGRNEQQLEILVDVEQCVAALRGIIRDRADTYSKNGGEAPLWRVSAMLEGIEEDDGDGDHRGTDHERREKTTRFRHAVAAVCESALVQGVLDIFALRKALKLQDCGQGMSGLHVRAEKLAFMPENLDKVLKAAILESEQELHQSYRIVLSLRGGCELRSRSVRRGLLETEFQLSSNMRFRMEYSLSQQLSILVERYRQIMLVSNPLALWHGFIFRDNEMNEIWSPGEDDAMVVRAEVMEQVLTGILRDSESGRNCESQMSVLSRFRLSDVEQARNHLMLRGVINVCCTGDGKRIFGLCRSEKNDGREAEGLDLWLKLYEECNTIEKQLEADSAALPSGVYGKLRDTALGQAVCGRDTAASTIATAMATRLVFFPGQWPKKLELQASLGRVMECGDSPDSDLGGRGDNARTDFKMDTLFRYSRAVEKWGQYPNPVGKDSWKEDMDCTYLELLGKVEEMVRLAGPQGLYLSDMLGSKLAQSCQDKKKLAQVVYGMLRKGTAYRFSIESDEAASGSGSDNGWNNISGVLYLWHTYTRPLQVRSETRDKPAEVLSIWQSGSGGPSDEKLARKICALIMHIVSKAPGIDDWSVARAVQTRVKWVPARGVADTVFALKRLGALRASQLRRSREPEGPFRASEWEIVTPRLDGFCERFVDGAGICKSDNRRVSLHSIPNVLREVSAEQLRTIGTILW